MEPLISIVTTTHNIVEKGQADDFNLMVTLLDMQTYPKIEHIVIDNASTDETVELLKDYKNKGYINFYSEKDTNKFDGYNKGLLRAKGKYITFLSCDDFLHDITALQDLVKTMELSGADFSFSPSYCRHPEDFVFLYMPSMFNVFQVMPCPRQCMFFKRSVLEKENGFDTKFKYMADFDLMIRLVMKQYKPVFFSQNYVTYKLGEKLYKEPHLGDNEAKMIFLKNYRSLYPLNEEILDRMVRYSELPQELIEKFATRFPEEDKQLFVERCEQMRQMRLNSLKKEQG